MLYSKLKPLEKHIKKLEKLGVIDTSCSRNIKIVERFFFMRERGVCVFCAHEFIAQENGISASSVKKIIKKLTS